MGHLKVDEAIGVNFRTAVIPSLLSGQTLSTAKDRRSAQREILRCAQDDRWREAQRRELPHVNTGTSWLTFTPLEVIPCGGPVQALPLYGTCSFLRRQSLEGDGSVTGHIREDALAAIARHRQSSWRCPAFVASSPVHRESCGWKRRVLEGLQHAGEPQQR
jgi:hypothetical protein